MENLHIIPIPALRDNYIWAITRENSKKIAIVDPSEHQPVITFMQKNSYELCSILITHHHYDHTGGIAQLVKDNPIPVWGATNSEISTITKHINDNDKITIPELDILLETLTIPGHTLDHIAYFGHDLLFCGDTLFTGGMGKIFEGTAIQMYSSIKRLSMLPQATKIYCGHEYTLQNLEFALKVEPNNKELIKRYNYTKKLREANIPTVPATLELELATNPFLRINETEVINSIIKRLGNSKEITPLTIFTELRNWKSLEF